jgi:hypothetical protein
MSTSLEKLQPAPQAKVGIYLPYYKSPNQRNALPHAIGLYDSGSLEGERVIDVSSLPADLTRCRLQFDGNADLSYELTIPNYDFINFLIELLINFKRAHVVDFHRKFYSKLLNMED